MHVIRGFVWDDENVAHIARRGVLPEEVEERPRSLAHGRTIRAGVAA